MKSYIRKVQKNKVRRYDEYYTVKEQVEDVFDNYIPKDYLKDKIVYSFCDSEESEFVKYIKQHKDELQYKEYIYTSDDYNTHYDLFENCDVIITNPPFSKLIREIIPLLTKVNKNFFIFGSTIAAHNYYRLFNKDVHFIRPDQKHLYKFVCPDPNLQNNPSYIYITNIENMPIYRPYKYSGKDVYTLAKVNGEIVRNYDRIFNVPENYHEKILVPMTVIYDHIRKYFNILDEKIETLEYLDGRNRYVRYFVKRKNI